nr:type IV pilus modification protein PilV [Halomonas sp. G15]
MLSPNRQHHGFTLIEALVALVVLSIGLLGVAALQVKSLQSAHLSYQHTLASLAAQDAAERLWVAYAYSSPTCPALTVINGEGSDWHDGWSGYFRNLDAEPLAPGSDGCGFVIKISWEEDRFFDENVSELIYVARLP